MVSRTVGYDTSRSIAKFREVMQGAMPMAVPAVSYCLQNLLAFVALQRLDAATFSVVNQLKILTSALFARLMLGRQASWSRWRALTLLLLGVLLVQREPCPTCDCSMKAIEASGEHAAASIASIAKSSSERFIGFVAALIGAISSGYAGIYFELQLRRPQTGQVPMSESENLWRKNFQLSFWGIVFNILVLAATVMGDVEAQELMQLGFFHGYSIVTWITILLSAFGGIMVALVVQYTDTIIKGFATSFAIILTAFGSWLWFEFVITFHFCIGVACVIIASFNYNQPEPPLTLASPSPSPLPSPSSQTGSSGSLSASFSSSMSGMSLSSIGSGSTTNDKLVHRQLSINGNGGGSNNSDDIELRRISTPLLKDGGATG